MDLREDFLQALNKSCPDMRVLQDEPLWRHTSFRIGGPADLLLFPRDIAQLQTVLQLLSRRELRPVLLGAGTNVLAPDAGVRGIVIVTRGALEGMEREGERCICAMAGSTLAKTALFAKEAALSGLEFAHGIPGTVGGGIYMNAGAYGGELRQVATKTQWLSMDGSIRILEGEEQRFGYRSSAFQAMDGIILRSWFTLVPGEPGEIWQTMQALAKKRRASQPLELPSAGSSFKRPSRGYAAALIEQAGLKGLRVGGACVSEKHAGFIVNLGGASQKDVLELMALVRERVYADSGITLEPEVRLWTETGENRAL